MFYSRRIGRRPHRTSLAGATYVTAPETSSIRGAAKLTGRTQGGLSVGALFAPRRFFFLLELLCFSSGC